MGRFTEVAVAAEDWTSWKRRAPVSFRGTLRDLWRSLRGQLMTQGASTISQQLARIVFTPVEMGHQWCDTF